MERTTYTRTYPRKRAAERPARPVPEFNAMEVVEAALSMPGRMTDTYSRFGHKLTMANEVLLYMQGVMEPVHTFKGWQELGRRPRTNTGKYVRHPDFRTVEDPDTGEKTKRLVGFKLLRTRFAYSDTDPIEGVEQINLEEYQSPHWQTERALGAFGLSLVAFTELDGDIAGYIRGYEIAINPVAKYPRKTLKHELGHFVLGHTLGEREYHNGIREGQAELAAYVAMHALGEEDLMDPAESRAYIRHHLQGEQLPDRAVYQALNAADRILKAGYGEEHAEAQS